MRRVTLLEFIVFSLVILIIAKLANDAFQPFSRRDERLRRTRISLYEMHSLIVRYRESGVVNGKDFLNDVRTMDGLWMVIQKTQVGGKPLLESPLDDSLLFDGWGRPFLLSIRKDAARTIIRIVSSGADGVFENGLGDDVFIELGFDEHGNRFREVGPFPTN